MASLSVESRSAQPNPGISGNVASATIPVRIYYEDTDAGGLVHHSNYLRYFERGREHLLGCEKLTELFANSGRSFVVASITVIYKKGAVWGDVLEIRTSTHVHSPYRVEFRQDVYRGDELLVEGHVFMATVQGSGPAMQLCKFPDYILNGEVPTIPGLQKSSDGSGSAAGSAARKPRRRLPPPRKNKGAGRSLEDQGWKIFGSKQDSQCVMTVYLDDTDFTGICYNGNYLKWMERARANAIGITTLADLRKGTSGSGGEDGVGAAIYKAELTFKKGAGFGDTVVISTLAKVESDYRVAFRHEIRQVPREVAAERASHGRTNDLFSDDELASFPLLVTAQISLVFLGDGGKGGLVMLPDAVNRFLK